MSYALREQLDPLSLFFLLLLFFLPPNSAIRPNGSTGCQAARPNDAAKVLLIYETSDHKLLVARFMESFKEFVCSPNGVFVSVKMQCHLPLRQVRICEVELADFHVGDKVDGESQIEEDG